jgi:hypothetical protein
VNILVYITCKSKRKKESSEEAYRSLTGVLNEGDITLEISVLPILLL